MTSLWVKLRITSERTVQHFCQFILVILYTSPATTAYEIVVHYQHNNCICPDTKWYDQLPSSLYVPKPLFNQPIDLQVFT